MVMTGRDVARRLAECGLHRSQVRALLAAGLAGRPTRAGRTDLYDEAVVDALTRRRVMRDDEIESLCPRGPFIARVSTARGFHLAAPWAEQAASLEEWYISPLTVIWMAADEPVRFPFVATVGDFVVWGADIVGWRQGRPVGGSSRRHLLRLDLAPPGDWFEGFANRRICLGPGYPYVVHRGPAALLRGGRSASM